jgi:GDSL-like Lipase/Acylhydrolase family
MLAGGLKRYNGLVEIPLDAADQLLRGAVCIRPTPDGILPLRLPEDAWPQVPDVVTSEVFAMSAGIRLSVTTKATAIELDVAVTRISVAGVPLPTQPIRFDLVVDGAEPAQATVDGLMHRAFATNGEPIEEPARVVSTIRFGGLPNETKALDIWFPANASVEIVAIRADAPLEPSSRRPRWIHYGSSISHCLEANSPTGTWPAVAARLTGVDLISLGFAGNCHLDPFVARAIRDAPADFVSLKVGINVSGGDTLKFRTFGPAVHGFLDTVREGHPNVPILLISPIICPSLENTPGPTVLEDDVLVARGDEQTGSLSLRRMREILEEIVAVRADDDPNLHYLDGLLLFGAGDVDELPDSVHPSPAGYKLMGERFAEVALRRYVTASAA